MDYYQSIQEKRKKSAKKRGRAITLLLTFGLYTVGATYLFYSYITSSGIFFTAAPADIAEYDKSGYNSIKLPDEVKAFELPDEVVPTINLSILNANSTLLALPENGKVDISYFSDAIFVGDSLTQGLDIYHIFPNASYAAYQGISPNTMLGQTKAADKSIVTPLDVIQGANPTKIYVMLGMNGLVWMSDEQFLTSFAALIDILKERIPNALIYIESITPVAEKKNKNSLFDNNRIRALNNELAKMIVEKGGFYINLHEVLTDEQGHMKAEYAYDDGMHMKPEGYAAWGDYLATHTVHVFGNPYLEGSPYFGITKPEPKVEQSIEEEPQEASA